MTFEPWPSKSQGIDDVIKGGQARGLFFFFVFLEKVLNGGMFGRNAYLPIPVSKLEFSFKGIFWKLFIHRGMTREQ